MKAPPHPLMAPHMIGPKTGNEKSLGAMASAAAAVNLTTTDALSVSYKMIIAPFITSECCANKVTHAYKRKDIVSSQKQRTQLTFIISRKIGRNSWRQNETRMATT